MIVIEIFVYIVFSVVDILSKYLLLFYRLLFFTANLM